MQIQHQIPAIPELYRTGNLVIIKSRLDDISIHPEKYSKDELIASIRLLDELVNEI